jgi:hypothetical protein
MIDQAAALLPRWEAGLRRGRREELAALERLVRLGRREARGRVPAFLNRFDPLHFADPTGRAEIVRLLQLYPADAVGNWRRDRRAAVVQWLLDSGVHPPEGRVVAETVGALDETPEPVAARAELAAGRVTEAHSRMLASGSVRTFAWTPFLAELSEHYLAIGEVDDAVAALELVPLAARGECDVLLARRAVASRRGLSQELAAVSAALEESDQRFFAEGDFTARGELSLCIDPAQLSGKVLHLNLRSEGRSVVDWGWDRGRLGSVDLNGAGRLDVPLGGLAGRHTFFIRRRVGAPVTATAFIER